MDHGIVADASLTPAERAVKYTLDVLQTRPELAWYLVGTETMHQLLTAEVHRRGLQGESARAFAEDYRAKLETSDPETFRSITCPKCDDTLMECPTCGADVDPDAWEVWRQ